MSSQEQEKVAIITGASRGIGRAIALRLGRDGWAVVVNYASRRADADRVVADVTASGGRAIAFQADVAQPADVARLFDLAEQAFGPVSLLVNSAGILQTKPIAETDDDLFERTFAINVRGTFNTLREAARRLRSGSRIINFSTSAIALNLPGYGVYGATKAAVQVMTSVFAKELRGKNITVNAVAPGPTATDLFFQGKSEELVQQFAKAAPLERLGQPEDIANAVAFLAGPESAWINGQTIRVNGGIA